VPARGKSLPLIVRAFNSNGIQSAPCLCGWQEKKICRLRGNEREYKLQQVSLHCLSLLFPHDQITMCTLSFGSVADRHTHPSIDPAIQLSSYPALYIHPVYLLSIDGVTTCMQPITPTTTATATIATLNKQAGVSQDKSTRSPFTHHGGFSN
jgi:hypothetical protein